MRTYALILATAVFSAACSGPYSDGTVAAVGPEEDAPVEVRAERIDVDSIPEVVSATGELYAEEAATLGPRVPGRIALLLVDLGDVVRKGQTLARLEADDYEFRVAQAEASVSQTRARLGILGRDGDDVVPEETAIVKQSAARLKEARFISQTTSTLAAEGVLSTIDKEKAGVALEGAEAAYQGALEEVMQLRALLSERRAQLDLARQNLADCVIRAPFDGAVTNRVASVGEYLPVNAPILTIVRQDPLRLRLEIPERYASRVRAGQRIEVRTEGGGAIEAGRVVRISPAIDAASRSLLIEGLIPNPRAALRPGAFAEAVLTLDAEARGMAVPRDSVVSFAGVERVFVVVDGKIEDRIVFTGRLLDGDRVEIRDGLEPGLSVVRDANDRLRPGQPARVR